MARLGRAQPFKPIIKTFTAPPAGIAFYSAANSGYQAASSSYTFNRTCDGPYRYLTVDVALLSAGQTVTSITDDNGGGNVAMTFLGARTTVSSVGRIESWGLIAPAIGTKQIQVNLSGSIASVAVAVAYTGVHQTSPVESFDSAQATNVGAADATVTITPVADKTWIHAALATDDGSVTAGRTSRNNVSGVGGSGANEDTGPISPAAATAMSYTDVGALATWAIAGYALRPVAAGALATTADTALSSAGSATAIAAAAAAVAATFSSAGASTATAATKSTAAAALSASGSSTATATTQSSVKVALSAAGTSVGTITTQSTVAAVLSSTGASTAIAVGSALMQSVLSSTGASVATLEGTFTAPGAETALSSAGTSTAISVGASTVATNLSSAGTSTAIAVGVSLAQAALSASGSSTATLVGASTTVSLGNDVIRLGARRRAEEKRRREIEEDDLEIMELIAAALPHLAGHGATFEIRR